MQNYEFSLEFNPDVIRRIYSLIKEDPAYLPRPYRGGLLHIDEALHDINDTRALRIGEGIVGEAGDLFGKQFPHSKAIVVADSNTWGIAGEAVEASLRQTGTVMEDSMVLPAEGLCASYDTMNALMEHFKTLGNNTVPVAVGAGTVNDIVKLAAHLAGCKYMCIPTAASMDGYTAYGAKILVNGIRQQIPCAGPQAVLADTAIIVNAPVEMTASGFMNLMAKMTAGADWILADWLGIEQINEKAWRISQSGFHEALMLTEDKFRKNDSGKLKVEKLVEGLMLAGFATQVTKSDMPTAGAEHLLSAIWESERDTNNDEALPHGVLLGIAEIATAKLYAKLMNTSMKKLDVAKCVAAWPDSDTYEQQAQEALRKVGLEELGMKQARTNYISREQLSMQLQQLKEYWPEVKDRLSQQIMPVTELKKRMRSIGLPVLPEKIGVSHEHLRQTLECAPYISKRFNIFSLAHRTGLFKQWLDSMFSKPGVLEA